MQSVAKSNATRIQPRLGLWDAVSIIVGIVVGTSIFRASAAIFHFAGGPRMALGLWAAGGALAWCGAVCYAELATTYPRDGGDYEYLNRAFGRWCGFLFAWAQLTTIISGNIAIMAYVFADYAGRFWSPMSKYDLWLTITPIVVLSAVNAAGIAAGKFTQNSLTIAKIIGLTGLVAAGLLTASAASTQPQAVATAPANASPANLSLALVFVLYAYGGWAHTAYVAAEVRDQRRNLPRALVLGIAGITLVYLAVNGAYLHALGFDTARHASAPAADVLERACGAWGGRAISLLVMLSALGAINGMILTAARIYAVWGADYPALGWLARWDERRAVPRTAITVQAIIAIALILLVGTSAGRSAFDWTLCRIGLAALPWEQYAGGFETLVAGSAPAFWVLSLLTGFAVFVLRWRDRQPQRPFSIPFYPLPAIIFCGTCLFMLQASLDYARGLSLLGFVPLAVGAIAWCAVRPSYTPRGQN